MTQNDVVLSVDQVEQRYPGVHALRGVCLQVERGQVLGLVGENGAGKSTLIRILAGIEARAAGRVMFKGNDVDFASPTDSQRAGISVVSQEFRLVPQLSVADNIFLRQELSRGGVIRAAETRHRTTELLELLELDVDPGQLVGTLSVADQQMVEIARALSREFDLLIMDEPTAALNGPEVRRLLGIVRKLADSGKSVIYVSHHLDEVFAATDVVTVFRDGSSVWSGPTGQLDEPGLVELMLGRKPETFRHEVSGPASSEDDDRAPLLEVSDVLVTGLVAPLSLGVMPGEVVGLAGLAGSGRIEVMRALYGDNRLLSGHVHVGGKRAGLRSPHAAVKSGIFMLSEDRKQEGILPHLDVTENVMVGRRRPFLRGLERFFTVPRWEQDLFGKLREQMSIRVPHGRVLVGNLSGGNQQKVMLGRAVNSQCRVLLLNEPTRGVDVGAKVEIYELVQSLADDGAAVVVSSSDVPELVAISNRCLAFYAGRVVAELRGKDITEENVVAASIGQGRGEGHRD